MAEEEIFMRRALALAGTGIGSVSPNPMVGCVIVVDGRIISEGWHQQYGQAHAEVNAVAAVVDKSLLKYATVYVNLEPCAHHGKTPPCADMLIHHKVRKVVIANIDTNPLVGGKGILKLQDAGIEVVTGILETEGRALNRRFFTFMEDKRPYIILKWAQTADQFIARENYDSKWISNEYSRKLVHRWRAEEDAVLVGKNTALHDNPLLTVRDWTGRSPIRIVIDHDLQLPKHLHLFDHSVQTICYNSKTTSEKNQFAFVKLEENNFLDLLLQDLRQRKIQSVIVEGGRKTLDLFIASGNWDEARVFTSQHSFGKGIEAPRLRGKLISRDDLFGDVVECFVHPDK